MVLVGCASEEEARILAQKSRIAELEAVAKVTNLTHEVVTQIIAGRDFKLEQAINLWAQACAQRMVLAPNTIATNATLLRNWTRTLDIGGESVAAISPERIAAYINRGKMRRTSALRCLSAIRSLFQFLVNEGYVLRNPAARGMVRVNYDVFTHEEKEPVSKAIFTDPELNRLLAIAKGTFWWHAISIAVETGLRLSDICSLERASIGQVRLVVWTDKTNTRINLPSGKAVLAALDRDGIHSQYLFPEERGIVLDPKRRATLSTQFSRLCKRAGINGKTFHCLRHTYATRRMREGLTVEDIGAELGHRGTAVTNLYLHPADSEPRATACAS